MSGLLAYRILCGAVGGLLLLIGVTTFASFFGYHMPGGSSPEPFRLGPDGAYFMAFTGCGMVVWGGCLLACVRRPQAAPFIASVSSLGLVMMALYRIVAWVVGDYHAFEGVAALRGRRDARSCPGIPVAPPETGLEPPPSETCCCGNSRFSEDPQVNDSVGNHTHHTWRPTRDGVLGCRLPGKESPLGSVS